MHGIKPGPNSWHNLFEFFNICSIKNKSWNRPSYRVKIELYPRLDRCIVDHLIKFTPPPFTSTITIIKPGRNMCPTFWSAILGGIRIFTVLNKEPQLCLKRQPSIPTSFSLLPVRLDREKPYRKKIKIKSRAFQKMIYEGLERPESLCLDISLTRYENY